MEYISLNNGVKMPILGYGVYQVTKEECERLLSFTNNSGPLFIIGTCRNKFIRELFDWYFTIYNSYFSMYNSWNYI